MKAFILAITIIFLYSCHSGSLRIPPHPAIEEIVSPLWQTEDTMKINITKYFPDLSLIQKISGSDNVEVLYDRNTPYVYIIPQKNSSPLSNLAFSYDGFNYDIPLLAQNKEQENSPLIFTDKIQEDTIYLRSNQPIETWAVYLHNHKLPDKYLFSEEERLGIVLPPQTTQLPHSALRIWANNPSGLSNEVYIPLNGKEVVEDMRVSDSIPEETASGEIVFVPGNPNPIYTDTTTNRIAVNIFIRQHESFIRLHRLITENRRIYEAYQQLRLLVNTKGTIPGFQISDSSSCNKLVQLWAFHITTPGISQIYPADTLVLPKGDTAEKLLARQQIAQLNTLYKDNISLLIGDFIPLRVEDKIYAYMRSYFGREIIVVFNKEAETITLKLDLPDIKRESNFKALFDNRFSYDNSKLLLDIPAHSVEVIYN